MSNCQLRNRDPYLQLLPELSHPFARELCWLLSPSTHLLTHLPPFEAFQLPAFNPEIRRWLLTINRHDLSEPRSKSSRLGIAFEHLIQTVIEHAPGCPYDLLHHGYPLRLRDNNQTVTLGELDFVLAAKNQTTANVHLEVAVKFYLSVMVEDQTQWLGPNANDALHKKCHHLQHKQLPISTEGPEKLCNELHIGSQTFLVKGALFHHWQQPVTAPRSINSIMTRNVWLHYSELAAFLANAAKPWFVCSRRAWLTGIPNQPGLMANTLLKSPSMTDLANQHPIMLSADPMLGLERAMVVNDHWPNT